MTTMDTNLKASRATTQFTNYGFNSYANFNGRQLAASDSGISLLGGESDNGADIEAYFEPVTTDFGDGHPKRLRFLYLGYEADGQIVVTIAEAGKPAKAEAKTIGSKLVGQQRARVPVSRVLSGRYWMFRIGNKNGSDFAIDSMHCLYLSRSHGLSQNT